MTYFVLDGPDGGGKSTQARLLCDHLRQTGRVVLHLREPGSTPVGEVLRRLLLSPDTGELDPVTEVLLFSAARAELLTRVVRPAVERGEVVVAERCYASTLAYQCLASEPPVAYEWVADLSRRVHAGCMPDAVFVLDVDTATAKQRRSARVDDRFEARDAAFHDRVREAYRTVARLDDRVHLIDAGGAIDAVQARLQERVQRWLP